MTKIDTKVVLAAVSGKLRRLEEELSGVGGGPNPLLSMTDIGRVYTLRADIQYYRVIKSALETKLEVERDE